MKHAFTLVVMLALGCSHSQPAPRTNSMDQRAALLKRIGDINDSSRPRPLVNLELFFNGNNDYGSIGYNLPDPPEPREFYDLLKRLRERQDVHNVLIEVKDLEDPEGWPSSDTIWFITTATTAEVRAWFPEGLAPDDVIEGFQKSPETIEPYDVPAGYRAVGAWYD